MTVAWLARSRQKCMFCSAISTVAPVPRSCRSNSPMRCTMIGARPSLGSSSSKSAGLPISVRAITSICCSPPESRPAIRFQQREHIIDPPDRPFVLALRTLLLADDEIVFHGMIGEYLPVFRHACGKSAGGGTALPPRRCRPPPPRLTILRLPIASHKPDLPHPTTDRRTAALPPIRRPDPPRRLVSPCSPTRS